MNYDEFAFFNQQLASMLREGIPLEGALKQLSAGLAAGKFRTETQALVADLATGTPLAAALAKRDLPEFYRRMVEVGARGNDLPGVLLLLADHYHRVNLIWTRLKGLMVYPVLVIGLSLALTVVVSVIFGHFVSSLFNQFSIPWFTLMMMWVPPVVLAILAVVCVLAISLPGPRERLRWRLPGFREASLAQLASAVALMLRNGTPLPDALALAEHMEAGSPAVNGLTQWRSNIQAGQGKPAQWKPVQPFPPLFLWLIQQSGEDAAAGFDKAAEIYQDRANYRVEMAMYGALPISVLFLGQMILWQIMPLIQSMTSMMRALGDMGNS